MSTRVFDGQLPNGWCSDVANPPQLGELVLSMQSSRSFPLPLMLEVHDPAGDSGEDVLLPVRATALRTVYPPEWDEPEYEFEGYVSLRPDGPEEVWIGGALRTNGETSIKECTLYLLASAPQRALQRTIESG
jgi:hypothetical protein